MVRELHDSGVLASFQPPSPLISTYPAITEIMLTEFYGIDLPPGYGLRYYDRSMNGLRGGLSDPEAISVWFKVYDYVTPMIHRGIVYLWGRYGWIDLDMMKRLIERTDRETKDADGAIILMHLDASDAMMHHNRANVTADWLRKLDETLTTFLARMPGRDVEIVLFSDHGNDRTPAERVPLERHLRTKGFRPSSIIEGESGVAILPTGLISTGYMYTDRERDVAEALRDMPGLDFALYETRGIVHVTGPRGRARIDRDPSGMKYRYRADEGDPFELLPTIEAMRREGLLDENGYAADRAWFEATWRHRYPDVLNRAWGGLTGHVRNVGDVLVSLADGWHCGSRVISTFFKFKGTHGSLTRESITGFAISNRRSFPVIRAEDFLDHIGWRTIIAENLKERGIPLRRDVGDNNGQEN